MVERIGGQVNNFVQPPQERKHENDKKNEGRRSLSGKRGRFKVSCKRNLKRSFPLRKSLTEDFHPWKHKLRRIIAFQGYKIVEKWK